MVHCRNPACEHEWIHLSCAKLVVEPQCDWYCSKLCKDSSAYIYCFCQLHTNEDNVMIRCAAGSDCLRHEYYHPTCIQGVYNGGNFY